MRIRIQQFARAAASWILSGSGGSSFTIVPCLAENLLCDLHIIKGDRTIPHHLHFFVALASDHHYVPRTGFMNRESYGRFAIRLRLIFRSRALQSDHGIVDNCERIFAARVIGGQHHEITAPAGGLAHYWALGAIAIAAAAKHSDHPTFLASTLDKLATESREIAECIIGMRIVHDDRKRLFAIDSLKAAGDASQRFDAACDSLLIAITRISRGRRSQDVVHVHLSDK